MSEAGLSAHRDRDTGFHLVPLDCPACGAPLAAGENDVVFYCTACRSGFRYDAAAERGLAPVEVRFVASPHRAAEGYLPFWLLPSNVEIRQRDASGAVLRGLVSFLTGRQEDGDGGTVYFVIPAVRLPIADTVELALRYTREFPRLDQLLGERLTGGVVSAEDARKLAEYLVIAAEVRKPDTLKDLDYRLTPGEPCLLGVPWVRTGERRSDALFGLSMGAAERLQ